MPSNENPGCLGLLLQFLGITGNAAPTFPYRVRDDFLSPSEMSFYRVLVMALDGRAIVCPKVRLSDILFVMQPQQNQAAFNRISQKHVDFLVCAPDTLRPLFALELDDRSHARPDRQARDLFMDRAFEVAKLPLVHIPAQRTYSLPELAARLEPLIAKPSVKDPITPTPPRSIDTTVAVPSCPKCGGPMIQRIASKGERAGLPFWGCPNYPRCRETKPVNS